MRASPTAAMTSSENRRPPEREIDVEVGSPETGDFLTVVGTVDTTGHLHIEPGFRVGHRERVERPELTPELLSRSLVLEFRDMDRELLSQSPIPLTEVCAAPTSDPLGEMELRGDQWIFATTVKFPPGTEHIGYYFGEELVHEVSNPHTKLRARVTRPPSERPETTEEIGWRITGASKAEVRSVAMLSYDDGVTWEAVTPPSPELSHVAPIHFEAMPGGTAQLRVLATDGFTTMETETTTVEIPTKGLRPMILSLQEGGTVPADVEIALVGQGYHYERRVTDNAELVWSVDGEALGRGPVIGVTLDTGRHEISLGVGDQTTSVTVVAGRRLHRPSPASDTPLPLDVPEGE